MIYKLINNLGVLIKATPTEVSRARKLTVKVDSVPEAAKLYLSTNKQGTTKCVTPNDKTAFAVSHEILDALLGEDRAVSIELKLIKDSAPYRVWNLDPIFAQRLDGGSIICIADSAKLREQVAQLRARQTAAEDKVTDLDKRLTALEKVFDGDYITE